jgi:hypothetical protein
MSHLLVVTRLQSKAMQRKGTVPLMLEYGVSDETAPYLVSSSSSVMWVNEAHPGSIVKAAVRQMALGDFFREVVEAITAMGHEMQWGNVQPLTLEGLRAAVEHVEFYEQGPVELLTPRAHQADDDADDDDDGEAEEGSPRVEPVDLMPPELRPLIEDIGLPFRPSSWVPEGTIVVVPKDRSFVGVVSRVTTKKIAGVIHNAARGIAIARGTGQVGKVAHVGLEAPPEQLAESPLRDADPR